MVRLSPLRAATLAALMACAFITSYALQRLAAGPGADPQQILATAHIPYFDRLRLALLHATAAGLLAAMGLREVDLESFAPWLPWAVVLVVSGGVAAMVWMP